MHQKYIFNLAVMAFTLIMGFHYDHDHHGHDDGRHQMF